MSPEIWIRNFLDSKIEYLTISFILNPRNLNLFTPHSMSVQRRRRQVRNLTRRTRLLSKMQLLRVFEILRKKVRKRGRCGIQRVVSGWCDGGCVKINRVVNGVNASRQRCAQASLSLNCSFFCLLNNQIVRWVLLLMIFLLYFHYFLNCYYLLVKCRRDGCVFVWRWRLRLSNLIRFAEFKNIRKTHTWKNNSNQKWFNARFNAFLINTRQ